MAKKHWHPTSEGAPDTPHTPGENDLKFKNKVELIMPGPNPFMYQGQKRSYQIRLAQLGVAQLMPTDSLAVVSSDESVATMLPDAVAAPGSVASGFILAGASGVVRITATLTRADKTAPSCFVDIDVLSSAPVGMVIMLGPPVAQ